MPSEAQADARQHLGRLCDVATPKATGESPDSGVAQTLPVAGWLCVPDDAPTGPAAFQAWSQCFVADPAGVLHFDPELALSARTLQGQPPLVYAHWNRGADAALQLQSLAVLPQRIHEVHVLGVPWKLALHGRRVMENRLLGDNSPSALVPFLGQLKQLLMSNQAKCIVFNDVEVDSPLRRVLNDCNRDPDLAVFCPSEPLPHWWVRFPENPQDYWKQFSKKTRYNFRYRAKHLDHSLVCITDKRDVRAFLDKVHQLCQQTWQHQRLGMSLGHTDAERHFWERVADLGALRAYLLEHDGRPIAYATGYQWKDHYTYEHTGYDPAYAAKSPGQVLLYRILEDLVARQTPKLFDFGYGHSEYKEMFANHQTLSGPMVLVRRALRPMAIMRLDQTSRFLARSSRAVLKRLGVLSLLRQLHRRRSPALP